MCMLATNWCNSNSLGLYNFSSLGQFYVEDQVVRGDSKRLTELISQKSRKSHTQIMLITLVIGVTPGLHSEKITFSLFFVFFVVVDSVT